MPGTRTTPLRAAALALAVLAAAGATWRLLQHPAPYALRTAPAVRVTVHAVHSGGPEAGEVADDVDLLVKVYVQRLAAGDAAGLARIGAPWYSGRERAARRLIAEYGPHAGEPVAATVQDPAVPYLAGVELRFGDGRRQTLSLSRGHDDVWWLQLGDGDPVAP
ncbi:hypothetical protein [Streptomyces sp. NPDC006193]|uniref:hypothetical protein n=1 Tax=Streptomyces sp. NPDC006193 TaxID=3155717 RepID=UPI0033AFB684